MATHENPHRRLAFVEASTRGQDVGLVLADDAGATYLLGVDAEVVDAIRTIPVRTPRREQPASGDEPQQIGPRDIQAFIRSGMSAADVADRYGLELARVERYEGPVLAERAWISDRARGTELRRPDASTSLNDLVVSRLVARGDDLASLEWDAWRRDDHRWVVQATWLALGTQVGDDTMASAHWVFDPVGHTIVPDDAAARALVDDTTAPAKQDARKPSRAGGDPYRVPEQDSAADDLTAIARAAEVTGVAPTPEPAVTAGAPTVAEPTWTPVVVDGGKVPEAVEVPEPAQPAAVSGTGIADDEQLDIWDTGTDDVDGVDEPADLQTTPAPDEANTPTGPSAPAAAKAAPKRKSGRASIPSWDEILLGTQTPDQG